MLKNLYASAILFLLILVGNSSAHAKMTDELGNAERLLAEGLYEEAFNAYLSIGDVQNPPPNAVFTIALFYDLGWGRKIDKIKACEWYEKAAALNVPLAVNNFAKCMEQGTHKAQDYTNAAQQYEKAISLGYQMANCHLGELYLYGRGVEQNTDKGLQLCQQAALSGSVPAMLTVAEFNLKMNTASSNAAALHWFSVAASYQSAPAQFYIGEMLLKGQGIGQDPIEARQWFEKAAAQGFIKAYYQTARLYYEAPRDPSTGLWTEHDLAKSYLWVTAALERNEEADRVASLKSMLKDITTVMPPSWEADLDKKLQNHLNQFPPLNE